jgi:tRNA(adenine34) deaminase
MRRALELAKEAADLGEVPVGAVVIREEPVVDSSSGNQPTMQQTARTKAKPPEIIAEAFNLRESTNDPSAHAEFIAIRDAAAKLGSWRLTDCTVIVTLEPCPMCAGLLVNARVKHLVYGADDPKAGAVSSLYRLANDRRLNHRMEVTGGVLAGRSSTLLRAFFTARRRAGKA